MSKRLTNTDPNPSKRFPQRASRLRPGQTGRFNSRQTVRTTYENALPISHTAKRNAYDRIKKIQVLERQKGSQNSYEELMRDVKNIFKDDIEISTVSIFPGQAKNQTGKAILRDGTFFVAFCKIILKCNYVIKKNFLTIMRQKFLPNVTQNKTIFTLFLQDEEEKIDKIEKKKQDQLLLKEKQRLQQQLKKQIKPTQKLPIQEKIEYPKLQQPVSIQSKPQDSKTFQDFATMTSFQKQQAIRKSCLKPSKQSICSERKSVRWSQIIDSSDSSYLNQIVQANKQFAQKERKEKQQNEKKQSIAQIRKNQSFLIDFFEINDIYDVSMVDIVGVVDEMYDKYAILLIRQKLHTPPPSYIKTRSTYMQSNEYQKEEKDKKEVLAIGLLKKIDVRAHNISQLKEIQKNYEDIWAYVQIDNPDALFLSSLPEQSVDSESQKKSKK